LDNNEFSVGDFVFLFFSKSGMISPGRVLEKNIRENLEGLSVEYFLEVYRKENGDFEVVDYKYDSSVCQMFSSMEHLRKALEDHISAAVNSMVEECESIYNYANTNRQGNSIEEDTTS